MSSLVNILFNVLLFIYNHIAFHDLGIAIILFTILVRIVLLPFFYKSTKDQIIMQKLQPHIKEIQQKHKDDHLKQGEMIMELYKKYKVNPFTNILFLVIQIPIFVALFNLFTREVNNIHFISTYFLGIVDLSKRNLLIVLLAALFQYLQIKGTFSNGSKKGLDEKNSLQYFAAFLGPIMTILIFANLPSALALYWMTFSIFSWIQQIFISKKIDIEKIAL